MKQNQFGKLSKHNPIIVIRFIFASVPIMETNLYLIAPSHLINDYTTLLRPLGDCMNKHSLACIYFNT